MEAFPQGFEAHEPERLRRLRLAHGEWETGRSNPAVHGAWARFVLMDALELPDSALAEGRRSRRR